MPVRCDAVAKATVQDIGYSAAAAAAAAV